jgi:hypothetical protein
VRVFYDGRLVAEHQRLRAKHQTISDPAHVEAAKLLRRKHLDLARQPHRPGPNAQPPRWRSAAWPTTTPPSASPPSARPITRWLTTGWRDGDPHHHHRQHATTGSGRDLTAEVAFLTRALKAPHPARVGVPAGQTVPGRVATRFPARKSLEEFDVDHARATASVNPDISDVLITCAHLGYQSTPRPGGRAVARHALSPVRQGFRCGRARSSASRTRLE